jgi:hypothetical protein
MSSFTTPLVTEYLDGFNWRIMEPFDYYRTDDPSSLIRIPKGFITDFASVPRLFWHLIPPTGHYGKAAVVHDWLYATEMLRRKDCDYIFYEAMGVLGVPIYKKWIMLRAVRNFGAPVWMHHSLTAVNLDRALGGLAPFQELDHSYEYAIA